MKGNDQKVLKKHAAAHERLVNQLASVQKAAGKKPQKPQKQQPQRKAAAQLSGAAAAAANVVEPIQAAATNLGGVDPADVYAC